MFYAYKGPSFPIQARRAPAGGLVEKAQSWFFFPRFDCYVGGICHEFRPRKGRREKDIGKTRGELLGKKISPLLLHPLEIVSPAPATWLEGGGQRNADISNRKKEALYNRFVTRRRQKRGRVSAANARLLSVS